MMMKRHTLPALRFARMARFAFAPSFTGDFTLARLVFGIVFELELPLVFIQGSVEQTTMGERNLLSESLLFFPLAGTKRAFLLCPAVPQGMSVLGD